MSYDLQLIDDTPPCPTCQRGPDTSDEDWSNVTYNIRPMLDYIGMPFQELEKFTGDRLKGALWKMHMDLHNPSNQDDLMARNPPNGWGSLPILKATITRLLDRANEMKNPRLEVS